MARERRVVGQASQKLIWAGRADRGLVVLGIRKKSGFEEDLARVSPLHVLLVGLLSGLLFVIGLIVLVNWVVAK